MKHKRRNFLINPRFQFRFAFVMCSWVIGLSLAFPLVLTEAFNVITDLRISDPRGPEVEQVLRAQKDMMRALLAFEVGFVLVIFVLAVFLSHRIAGPLYKLNMYLREAARTGKLKPHLQFRSGDHFQELAESYNAMVAAVQNERPTQEPGTQKSEARI
ncbi:MAG: hypothetical protein KGQ59_01780 [Bdellovibrionales bacterium]|nr:hypothetical protein [Bdellovibrionales bacterium]